MRWVTCRDRVRRPAPSPTRPCCSPTPGTTPRPRPWPNGLRGDRHDQPRRRRGRRAARRGGGRPATRHCAGPRAWARGPFLLSVDAEGGFSDDPDEVAEWPGNWRPSGPWHQPGGRPSRRTLVPPLHAAKIAAVKAAGTGPLRQRPHRHPLAAATGEDDDPTALDAYQQAGADGVFVPGPHRPGRHRRPRRAPRRPPQHPLHARPAPPSPTSPTSGCAASASARCSTDGRWVRRWRRRGDPGRPDTRWSCSVVRRRGRAQSPGRGT